MKTSLLVMCFLCATAAMGQSIGGASVGTAVMSSSFQVASHIEHASPQPMGVEQNLLGQSAYYYAQGERPLWEVAPVSHPVPLGDVARMVRKEHASAKKADIVWDSE
jgi:hypothetical protein